MAIFDFFRKRQQPAPDRYEGKPLLKIIEAFVFDAIGELTPAQQETMRKLTPKLQEVYKSSSSWQGIVIEVMHWDPSIGSAIRDMWERNQGIARANGVTLSPDEFVAMFVDTNVDHR